MLTLKRIILCAVFAFVIYHLSFVIYDEAKALSQDCSSSSIPFSQLDKCIGEIEKEVGALKPAHENNQKELASLKKQLADIKASITSLTNQVNKLATDIDNREEDLGVQEELLNKRVHEFYIRSRQYSPVLAFLASNNATELARELMLRSQAANEDKRVIAELASKLIELKADKETLEKSRASLSNVQKQVDSKATFLAGEVAKTESYISSLSAKQQSLLNQKSGGFQTSIGDTPPTLEPCSGAPGSPNYCNPGFTAFGAFSFGAPHRAGMSQYGAYGRSKSGQSAEQILSAYYQGAELKKDYESPADIGVNGIGRVSLEDNYMLGIYEVPESWGDKSGFEALKAQAVAARSYALAVTNNGSGSICTTEACQVYKPQLKTGKWAEAVKATRGWVLMKEGSVAKTYYASTSGGYTINKYGWSGIKDAAADWPSTAYEKVSESPWFYKGWYKSRGGAACGRSNPWLTSEEMADILNGWHVLYNGGGDASRVSPLDTGCWPGNPYSKDDLKNIGGHTSVSSAEVVYSNDGSTQSVTLSTNKGSVNIPGADFKRAFNLRAPGYIGIKSELFNIVRAN